MTRATRLTNGDQPGTAPATHTRLPVHFFKIYPPPQTTPLPPNTHPTGTPTMSQPTLQPPVPFSDFEFTFDPSLSNLFPNPPPLPSSADLFSPSETTDLLGFLDNFGDFNWEFSNTDLLNAEPHSYDHVPNTLAPYSNPHLNTSPEPSTSTRQRPSTRSGATRGNLQASALPENRAIEFDTHPAPKPQQNTLPEPPESATQTFSAINDEQSSRLAVPRSKPLLSTPQKRLNHILSEQKRRNAIRDGYAQLITLMAPAGSAPGIGMPTRGRPKGSGSRGKGQTKGKSGVLFRAVEYCRWLEEGRDALKEEVQRVEAAASIRHP